MEQRTVYKIFICLFAVSLFSACSSSKVTKSTSSSQKSTTTNSSTSSTNTTQATTSQTPASSTTSSQTTSSTSSSTQPTTTTSTAATSSTQPTTTTASTTTTSSTQPSTSAATTTSSTTASQTTASTLQFSQTATFSLAVCPNGSISSGDNGGYNCVPVSGSASATTTGIFKDSTGASGPSWTQTSPTQGYFCTGPCFSFNIAPSSFAGNIQTGFSGTGIQSVLINNTSVQSDSVGNTNPISILCHAILTNTSGLSINLNYYNNSNGSIGSMTLPVTVVSSVPSNSTTTSSNATISCNIS